MRPIIVLITLLLIPSVFGIGVSPADRVMTESGDFTFRAITDVPVTVHAEGDLAQYIMLESATVQPGESIKGKIDLPQGLAPGDHQQYIVISSATSPSEGFGGAAEIAASLLIQIPYPEEYLDANWDIAQDAGTGVALITVTVQNLGSKNTTPEEIGVAIGADTLSLTTPMVEKQQFAQVQSSYIPAAPGVYDAILTIRNGEQVITKTRTESFGLPALTLERITYNDEAGAIKPVDITGTIAWNRPLNVSVEIYFDNDSSPILSSSFLAEGAFTERLYLTTDRDPAQVRVMLRAGGQKAELATMRSSQEREFPLLLAIIVLLLIALIAVTLWKHRREKPSSP
jgi:hypothetical protein